MKAKSFESVDITGIRLGKACRLSVILRCKYCLIESQANIPTKGITRLLLSRSLLNLSSKLLLVKKVIFSALIRQKRVKYERESKDLVIKIFDMFH